MKIGPFFVKVSLVLSSVAGVGLGVSAFPNPAAADVLTTQGPHLFDTCFSPGGSCDQKLIAFFNNTKTSLDIAIYGLTHQGICQAIVAAKNRGVTVRLIMDKVESKIAGSCFQDLVTAGVNAKIGKVSGLFHDKYSISDGTFLETGSFNYTLNATNDNAENQLYLNDAAVIAQYQADYESKWANATAN